MPGDVSACCRQAGGCTGAARERGRRAPAIAVRQRGVLGAVPFRLNRNGALDSCFDACSSREPASTSLENALDLARGPPRNLDPPVVDPVLPRQHASWTHRLDGEVARQRQRSGEVIDAPLTPREALDPRYARAAQPPIAL